MKKTFRLDFGEISKISIFFIGASGVVLSYVNDLIQDKGIKDEALFGFSLNLIFCSVIIGLCVVVYALFSTNGIQRVNSEGETAKKKQTILKLFVCQFVTLGLGFILLYSYILQEYLFKSYLVNIFTFLAILITVWLATRFMK